MSDTTDRLPAVRDTSPLAPYPLPALSPANLEAAWHDTGAGEGYAVLPHNQLVYRALEAVVDGIARVRDPQETIRRAAIVLGADPHGGTPYRCRECRRPYTAPPVPADWAIAGRDDLLCPTCTEAPTPPADKEIKITPRQAAAARRTRRTTKK